MSATTKSAQFPTAVTTAFTNVQASWDAWQNTPSSPLDSVRTAFRALETATKHECSKMVAPLLERFDKLDLHKPEQIQAISDQITTIGSQLFPKITTPPSSLVATASTPPKSGLKVQTPSLPIPFAYSEGFSERTYLECLRLFEVGKQDDAYKLALTLPNAGEGKNFLLISLRDHYFNLGNLGAVETIDKKLIQCAT